MEFTQNELYLIREDKNNIKTVVEIKTGQNVIYCDLFENGFEFETEEYGWKLYDLKGNDLIGDKSKGQKVVYCNLYKNGFRFETEEYGWELYDLNGNDLIGDKSKGQEITSCHLNKNGFEFNTKEQGLVKVSL